MKLRAHTRGGFTLLELLLASAIGLILLSSLYLALNVTVQQTQASRDAPDIEDLSRGAFNRIAIDLSAVLGPLPPKASSTQNAGGSGTTGGATGMTGGTTGGATGGMTGATDMSGMT